MIRERSQKGAHEISRELHEVPQPTRADFRAAPMLSKVWTHCARTRRVSTELAGDE